MVRWRTYPMLIPCNEEVESSTHESMPSLRPLTSRSSESSTRDDESIDESLPLWPEHRYLLDSSSSEEQALIHTRTSENIFEISHRIHRIHRTTLNSPFHNVRRCSRCGSLISVGTLHFCDPVQSRTFLRINIPRNRFLIPDLLVCHRETDSNGSDS